MKFALRHVLAACLSAKLRDGVFVAALVVMVGLLLRSAVGAAGDRGQTCTDNLYKLSQAIQGYTQDYDQVLPQMNSVAELTPLLGPYISQNQSVINATFRCPATKNTPYQPNASLSGQSLGSLGDEGGIEVFRDSKPHPDGKTTVAYFDGTILRDGVQQQPSYGRNICVRTVKTLTFAFLMYAQDYDETLPIFNNNAEAKAALYPYVRSDRLFQCPETAAPYNFNLAINGVAYSQIPDFSAVELVRDSTPHHDNTVTIGYLDNYVQRGNGTPNENALECLSRAKQLALNALYYMQDHNYNFPPMNNAAAFKNALMPAYGKASRIFSCPETKLAFVPNAALKGRNLNQIDAPAQTILFREPKPHKADGKITVAYCDGHADRILP